MSDQIIPDIRGRIGRIVTDYLYEPDRIKLHAFGIKSDVCNDVIPYDFPELEKRNVKLKDLEDAKNYIDLDLIDRRDGVDFIFAVGDYVTKYHFRFRTSAKYAKISFPDIIIGGVTVESDTLEHLIVDAGSMSYLTYDSKTSSLQTLRAFGIISDERPFLLQGAGTVSQLFLESNSRTSGSIQIDGEMRATEYYGDVFIDPDQFPELQVYSISDFVYVDDYDKLTENIFEKFKKLEVFACEGEVSTRQRTDHHVSSQPDKVETVQ